MNLGLWLCFFLTGTAILLPLMGPFSSQAECRVESASHGRDAFVKHLSKACTEDERLAHAVHAEELLQAIQRGQEVDLVGVVVVGNLFLDQLAVVNVPAPDRLSPLIEEVVTAGGVKTLRIISRALSIRESRIRGTIATKLKEGYLLMQGPVIMTGTICEEMVDLSHTMFGEAVDLSDAVFRREGLFLQTVFNKPARFERVVFGAHTRFHRARVGAPVTFSDARFNGLAEFLEVAFDKETSFAHSNFKLGTGFSGDQFAGTLDFSEALFERDVYFLFTRFAGDASFRGSTFRGQADFSDAEFHGTTDFTGAFFTIDPVFQRTTLSSSPPTRGEFRRDLTLYGIAASLMVFTVLVLWIFKRR